ncbi:hypothetical protein SDC9_06235 [bioreactor metagenome]|uniref:Phosphatidate cytidylyltransferase n=1 Tax=bioreactor metagenome TaxID=1076179 RepID=A0A644T1F5_9ZZZZ|nr:phosphatidate cytidylyltransferase [Negativicutes bacterium]
MVGKRILTAIVGIAIAIFVIDYGQWLFAAAVIVLSLITWHEYCNMLKNQNRSCLYLPGMAGVLLLQLSTWLGNSYEINMIVFLFLLVVLLKVVLSFPKFTVEDAAFNVFGLVYVGLSFSYILAIRFLDFTVLSGMYFLWIALVGTWSSDTFAYLVGSKFGKTKLCPALSPGKTREGAIGGLLGCILSVFIFGQLVDIAIIHSVVLGIIIGIASPVGDLAESALKRFTCVKDSGKILPGHGGVLDRFDSVMFSVPVVYYYASYIMI